MGIGGPELRYHGCLGTAELLLPGKQPLGADLSLTKSGYCSRSLYVELEQAGKDQDFGDFLLQPAGALTGLVLDAGSQPAVGARAVLQLENNEQSDPPGFFTARHGRAEVDADGRFAFPQLPTGTWSVALQGMGWSLAEQQAPITLDQGQECSIVLSARRSLPITGRVVTASGEPAADLQVLAGDEAAQQRVSELTFTDAQGRFELWSTALPAAEAPWVHVLRRRELLASVPAVPFGTRDLLIALEAPQLRILARDAATGNALPLCKYLWSEADTPSVQSFGAAPLLECERGEIHLQQRSAAPLSGSLYAQACDDARLLGPLDLAQAWNNSEGGVYTWPVEPLPSAPLRLVDAQGVPAGGLSAWLIAAQEVEQLEACTRLPQQLMSPWRTADDALWSLSRATSDSAGWLHLPLVSLPGAEVHAVLVNTDFGLLLQRLPSSRAEPLEICLPAPSIEVHVDATLDSLANLDLGLQSGVIETGRLLIPLLPLALQHLVIPAGAYQLTGKWRGATLALDLTIHPSPGPLSACLPLDRLLQPAAQLPITGAPATASATLRAHVPALPHVSLTLKLQDHSLHIPQLPARIQTWQLTWHPSGHSQLFSPGELSPGSSLPYW